MKSDPEWTRFSASPCEMVQTKHHVKIPKLKIIVSVETGELQEYENNHQLRQVISELPFTSVSKRVLMQRSVLHILK